MSKILKIVISLVLIFFAVPYVAYGVFKYMPDEQEDTVEDITDYMDDIFGSFPKMDEEIGPFEFIDIYAYTLFYGLSIGMLSFILGIIAGSGSKKKSK